jgi:hypothetical protein
MITTNLGTIKLKVLQVQEGVDFKRNQTVNLKYDANLGSASAKLEWFPRIQMLAGKTKAYVVPQTANSGSY